MTSPRLFIEEIKRTTADGDEEILSFASGVNVIVGAQNTGKSTWLKMLDYLMGGDGAPTVKFDEALVKKYRSISATFRVGAKRFTVERGWAEGGNRSTCALNGEKYPAGDVTSLFMQELSIPEVRYPQGNIFTSDRTWPTLGWRSLFRHIYRRQDHWGELVPNQPESEQHACLLQFLGIAEHLFTDDQAKLVDAQKALTRLEVEKHFLADLMNKIVVGLIEDPDVSVGLTDRSIVAAEARILHQMSEAISKRDAILDGVKRQAVIPEDELSRLSGMRTNFIESRDGMRRRLGEVERRMGDLDGYVSNLKQERSRLDRVDVASGAFSALKVTHCPVCDQSVEKKHPSDIEHCFLCDQVFDEVENNIAARKRLEFERTQISAELVEAVELVSAVSAEKETLQREILETEEHLQHIRKKLLPFQSSVAMILPQEASAIEQQIGSFGEQLQTLNRLRVPLSDRDKLSVEIDRKRSEVKRLEAVVSSHEEAIEYELASDRLSEGFNSYLNAIRKEDSQSWTKAGAVSVRIDDRRARFLIGERQAKDQLGGTLTLFFLFAYHYALLSLSKFGDCHYPGIAILDLFPDIAKGVALGERIGLVLHPFIRLLSDDEMDDVQFIMTSRDYTGDESVHLIKLNHVWA